MQLLWALEVLAVFLLINQKDQTVAIPYLAQSLLLAAAKAVLKGKAQVVLEQAREAQEALVVGAVMD